jgi:hypothetical protein
VLVPGWAQWGWGQRERGAVLFGWYAGAMAVGAFAWGTPLGLAVLAFAFGTHAVSVVDAIRQSAFPALGRWAAWLTATGWLGGGVYAPALALASVLAWPGVRAGDGDGSRPEGYLVNCRAYREADPLQEDWVWYRPTPWAEPRLGRVVAGAGQDVEWIGGRLHVGNQPLVQDRAGRAWILGLPFRASRRPQALAFQVPEGHVLVNPEGGSADRRTPEELVIVGRRQIVGRAWAQYYPILDRRLLN